MIKKLTLLLICFAVIGSKSTYAQTSSSATQTVHIQVAPAIEIITNSIIEWWKKKNGNGFGNGFGNGKSVGNNENGFGQEVTIRSNKDFMVSVQTIDANSRENILLALKDNNTGGKANPAFSDYAPVGPTSQDLLMNCNYGADKSFSVNYKKSPKAKAQSITKADLIYTATLP